jgi:TPR repeat protein
MDFSKFRIYLFFFMEGSLKKLKSSSFLIEEALKAKKEGRYSDFVNFLNEGSNVNDSECNFHLAKCHFYGYYEVTRDRSKAYELYRKNVKKHHYKSMAIFADLLRIIDKDWLGANELGRIILNYSDNMFAKAYCYKWGLGTEVNHKKAFAGFVKSAEEEEDDDSQFQIGNYFELAFEIEVFDEIRPVEYNKIKSIEWYLKSAEQGNLDAQNSLAFILKETDYEKSLFWLKKYYKASGDAYELAKTLNLSTTKILRSNEIDLLVDQHLADCYLIGKNVNEKNEYLSWYFFKKSGSSLRLKELEQTIFKGFAECLKTTLTLLCISKYYASNRNIPKDVFVMLAKYVWKTKNAQEWK